MAFKGTTIPKLPVGFTDESWHNDVCSHFEKRWNRFIIEIWIAQDNPAERECAHQYLIAIKEPEECEFEEFVEFSKEDFSEDGLAEVSRRIWKEVYRLMKKYQ